MKDTKLRIDAYRHLGTAAALQIPIKFEKMPSFCSGALVKDKVVFIEEQADYETQLFVYCHELLHFILSHLERGQGKDWQLWGIAIDHVVNSILCNTIGLVSRNWVHEHKMILFDQTVPEGPAELIYRELQHQVQKAMSQGTTYFQFGGETIVIHSEGTEVDGKNKTQHGSIEDKPQIGKGALSEFEQTMKSRGNTPGGVFREIERGYKPQVNWQRILVSRILSFIGTKISSPTYTKIPYYQLGIKDCVRLPSRYKKNFALVSAFDTSGSISQRELSTYFTELSAVYKYVSDLWVYVGDAAVHAVLHNPDLSTVQANLKGGGGTSFVPVFEDVERRKLRPQLLVYFTDTFGEFPKRRPTYPVIWIVVRTFETYSVSVPFGTVYFID